MQYFKTSYMPFLHSKYLVLCYLTLLYTHNSTDNGCFNQNGIITAR